MADYTWRTETTSRVVYALPNPTNSAELGKAYLACRQDLEARGIDSKLDDAVTIEADEDEIRLTFKIKDGAK